MQVHKRITSKDLLTPAAVIDILGTLFEKDGDRIFRELIDVADWYEFFRGYSQRFHGTGTARTPNAYYGRSVHAMRVTLDEEKQAVIQYKEFDTDHEDWQGHWNTQKPIRVFPSEERPDEVLRPYPREVVKNLPFVKEKVDAMFMVLQKTVDKIPRGDSASESGSSGVAKGEDEDGATDGSDESEMDTGDNESTSGFVPEHMETGGEREAPGRLRKGFTQADINTAQRFWDKYLKVTPPKAFT